MNSFASRLRDAIAEAGYTIAEVERLAEISHSAMGSYVSGRAIPRGDVVARLSDLLNVTCDWLLKGV